jgi:hypothetical protein
LATWNWDGDGVLSLVESQSHRVTEFTPVAEALGMSVLEAFDSLDRCLTLTSKESRAL